jgi:putative transposase
MLGISRWAGPGGSYRTVQRFFSHALPWAMLFLGVLSSASLLC